VNPWIVGVIIRPGTEQDVLMPLFTDLPAQQLAVSC